MSLPPLNFCSHTTTTSSNVEEITIRWSSIATHHVAHPALTLASGAFDDLALATEFFSRRDGVGDGCEEVYELDV